MSKSIYNDRRWRFLNDAGFWIEVSALELRELAQSGRITPETVLECNDATMPAGKMTDLKFPEWMQPVGKTLSARDRLLVGAPAE